MSHIHPIYDQESTFANFYFSGGIFGGGVHEHGMAHEHLIPNHPHPHDHYIPSQEVVIEGHDHDIPDHAHTLDYGIYYSDSPDHTTIKIDGVTIDDLMDIMYMNDFDLLPFVRKDVNGSPQMGWHEIEFFSTDAAGSTGSVSGCLFVRKFVTTGGQ